LAAGKVVHLETVACINDFKLLLISWVYDLSFNTSYRLVETNNYLQKLLLLLPDRKDIGSAINSAQEHIERKMAVFSP
jgi:hypothetical protein